MAPASVVALPFVEKSSAARPVSVVSVKAYKGWHRKQTAGVRAWLDGIGARGVGHDVYTLPARTGGVARAILVVPEPVRVWDFGALATKLPPGVWKLDGDLAGASSTDAAIGFGLGAWRFERYKEKARAAGPKLLWPGDCDRARATSVVEAVWMGRDLITTPASDMGPPQLSEAAQALAKKFGAKCTVLVGDELLNNNWPTVHAVGRAAARPPRVIDIVWGKPDAPKVALIGKGVCFDSGGLDLKPAPGMLMMKKDMGGAATVLAAAAMIMAAKLDVRLRVIVPAVENSVSGDAFRPMDVIKTRKGLTVEIGNTDAEGRLILCDALAEAASESPALIVDCATLTGAARVALGPDLPALFANDDATAEALLQAGRETAEPMWRMPLWKPYRKLLDSKVADLNNVSAGPFAGSITAALYLQAFVPDSVPWLHLDMMAWNGSSSPGKPEGGETQAARAIARLVETRFARR